MSSLPLMHKQTAFEFEHFCTKFAHMPHICVCWLQMKCVLWTICIIKFVELIHILHIISIEPVNVAWASGGQWTHVKSDSSTPDLISGDTFLRECIRVLWRCRKLSLSNIQPHSWHWTWPWHLAPDTGDPGVIFLWAAAVIVEGFLYGTFLLCSDCSEDCWPRAAPVAKISSLLNIHPKMYVYTLMGFEHLSMRSIGYIVKCSVIKARTEQKHKDIGLHKSWSILNSL